MRTLVSLTLRLGLAFAFLYPPISALINPDSWIGYFPSFVRGVVPDAVLLHSFGLMEIVIAVWLMSGKKIFYAATVAMVFLFLIVVFNLAQFEVVFRDVSIATIALSLMCLHWPRPYAKK
jgi:uncharacterized membrane protein YphA (DoxX/SURF4 family)